MAEIDEKEKRLSREVDSIDKCIAEQQQNLLLNELDMEDDKKNILKLKKKEKKQRQK